MTDPSGPHNPTDSQNTPPQNAAPLDPLEHALSELTRPSGDGPDLFAKAWDQAQAEEPPRVFELKKWLAPMAVAATLTLVGLVITTNAPSRVPESTVAMDLRLPAPMVPGETQSALAEVQSERAADQLSFKRDQAIDKQTVGGTRQAGDARGEAKDEAKYRELAVAPASKADSEARADKNTEGDGNGRKAAESLSKKAADKPADDAKLKAAANDPAANDPAAKELAEKEGSDADRNRVETAKTESGRGEPPAPSAAPASPPPAPVAVAPVKPDLGQVPVPGGNSAQNRANSQFDGKAWHQDSSNQQQAPGPESVGRLKSTPRAGSGGVIAGREIMPGEPALPVTVGWANRVFVQGRWWWLGIGTAIVAFTLYWRRRLNKAAAEPVPDQ